MKYFTWGFSIFLALLTFVLVLYNCNPISQSAAKNVVLEKVADVSENQFADYWYKGEAEICSYTIKQNRYGEIREGKQIMVFVTEDFSKSKHVKLDYPEENWRDKVSVLKLNRIIHFITGIYDYSMMASIFTPVDYAKHPNSLKAISTVQEWCGQTSTQLNLNGNSYQINSLSYFEAEGDDKFQIGTALLEDEIWNKIRINPSSIPIGNIEVIPSLFSSRLLHKKLKPTQARLRIENKESMSYLILEYLHVDRTLKIGFETEFPHKILNWEETQNGQIFSSGQLLESIKSAYWKENGSDFEYRRKELKL